MEEEEVIKEYSSYSSVANVSDHLTKTYMRMGAGLFVTAFIAYVTYSSGVYLTLPYLLLAILEIVLVLVFSFALTKVSSPVATMMYYGYAVLNGLTFSTIFAAYEMGSIASSFFTAGALFAGLAIFGYSTKMDLSRFGNILLIGLIVGLIATIVNLFIGSSMITIIVSWAMLFLFCGLTAYDMQKFRVIMDEPNVDHNKLYSYFALALYLDFINIFLKLIRLFGKRK